jgi:ribosome-associated protein
LNQDPLEAPSALKDLVASILTEGKAEDITVIALEGKSSVADFMIIASGQSPRHLRALSERLVEAMHKAKVRVLSVEGLKAGDWVLVDLGDVIVQLFRPEVRTFYNLEKMWSVELPARRAGARVRD